MPASPPGTTQRLTKTSEYKRVYTTGKLIKGRPIWVYCLPTAEGNARFGISISRNVIRKATDRNRLKRVIREWLRHNVSGSSDTVVVLKKTVKRSRSELQAIRKELTRLFETV